MLLLYMFVVAVLAIGRPASLQSHSFGKVLARDDDKTFPPAPLIFYNLTEDEYTAKRLEHHGPALNKRVAFGQETRNKADQQAIVEFWTDLCAVKKGQSYRFRRGLCLGEHNMRASCCVPGTSAGNLRSLPQVNKGCTSRGDRPKKCVEKKVINYEGSEVKGPYCVDAIPVDTEKEEEEDIENEREHEEEKKEEENDPNLPDYDFDAWASIPEPMSPGTWDFFYEMTGGKTGHFAYYANAPDGQKFRSESPPQSRSWVCMGCPSGILHIMTLGFKSEALGFSIPSGEWW